MVASNKFLAILVILGLVVFVNLALIDFKLFIQKRTENTLQSSPMTFESSKTATFSPQIATSSGSSNSNVEALIDSKLAQLRDELLKTLQVPAPKTQITTSPIQPQPKEIFINFGVNGSTKETSWTDISGSDISFDVANYAGAKALYFQTNLKSDAPDRTTFARIYDATHNIGVQGSDINYTALTSKLTESGSLTFWSGKLTLRVQIHSLNGNLATIENPRIRVVY